MYPNLSLSPSFPSSLEVTISLWHPHDPTGPSCPGFWRRHYGVTCTQTLLRLCKLGRDPQASAEGTLDHMHLQQL